MESLAWLLLGAAFGAIYFNELFAIGEFIGRYVGEYLADILFKQEN